MIKTPGHSDFFSDEREDSEASTVNGNVYDPLLINATGKQRTKTERKDKLIPTKENDQFTNTSTQAELIKTVTDSKAELCTYDIKLKDITLKEFLEILDARLQNNTAEIVNEILQKQYLGNVISNNRPFYKLQPRAHTRSLVSFSDSGMSSDSGVSYHSSPSIYADSPSNYV